MEQPVDKKQLADYVESLRTRLSGAEKALNAIREEERLQRIADGKSQFKAKFQEAWDNHKLEPYWGGEGSAEEMQRIIIDFIIKYQYDMRMTKANVLAMLDFWDDIMYL